MLYKILIGPIVATMYAEVIVIAARGMDVMIITITVQTIVIIHIQLTIMENQDFIMNHPVCFIPGRITAAHAVME